MDITTFTSEFNQYTLIQKKLFLDWIELPIENDEEEEARQRFVYSLDNPNDSNGEEELDEIKIQERFDLLIQRIEAKKQKHLKNMIANPIGGPEGVRKLRIQEDCKKRCNKIYLRNSSEYKKCAKNCMK